MKRNLSILVIDDDPRIRRLLQLNLEAEGYTIFTAVSGHDGLELLFSQRPHALILDLILSDMDGLALCERVREFSDIPIVVLTARTSEDSMVNGLQLGADDYIVKPFSHKVLLARLQAVLRRASFAEAVKESLDIAWGGIVLHCRERRVELDDRSIVLSRTEFKLLYHLMANANRLLTTDELVERVWGSDLVGDTQSLRTYIRYLRLKLEDDPDAPQWIVTERGIGYMFVAPD
jgi:DNA-binding response OmpR family regulator